MRRGWKDKARLVFHVTAVRVSKDRTSAVFGCRFAVSAALDIETFYRAFFEGVLTGIPAEGLCQRAGTVCDRSMSGHRPRGATGVSVRARASPPPAAPASEAGPLARLSQEAVGARASARRTAAASVARGRLRRRSDACRSCCFDERALPSRATGVSVRVLASLPGSASVGSGRNEDLQGGVRHTNEREPQACVHLRSAVESSVLPAPDMS